MRVLSLFDGMSCGRIALERAGLPVTEYLASEIDKYAIQVSESNYPDIIRLGDVRGVDPINLGKIDLLIGGSPCQSFSFAGKRAGMATKEKQEITDLSTYLRLKSECFEFEGQSYLFWEYVRVLEGLRVENPGIKFLLENVDVERRWELVISRALGVNPVVINSRLVSAQNRVRLYWTDIGMKPMGLFGDMHSIIEQPKDRGLLLKDVLEQEVDEKYYLSANAIKYLNRVPMNQRFLQDEQDEKGGCITANYHKGVTYNVITVAMRGRNPDNPTSREPGLSTEQRLEPIIDGKTNTLTTVQKDNLIQERRIIQLNMAEEFGGQPRQQNRVYSIEGVSPALLADMSSRSHAIRVPEATKKGYVDIEPGECFDFTGITSTTRRGRKMTDKANAMTTAHQMMRYTEDYRIRRLTPLECERLQTVPDNEIICVFALCLDQVKNYVNAVEQNPKLLKLALSAEKEELNEFVKLANQNMKQNNQLTKSIVQQGVDMMTQRQINQCTKINQKENNTTVNNAENIVMCKSQNQEEDFVLPNVFINITEGRTMRVGMEELHQKGNHSTIHLNGKKPLALFGNEIMQLVKDVDAGMKKTNDLSSIFTTLSVLSTKSLEQMLATYYWFAKSAITGFTQDTTNQNSLSVQFQINDGYTAVVSDTARYKMLGNGWTVDVIVHIFSYLKQ